MGDLLCLLLYHHVLCNAQNLKRVIRLCEQLVQERNTSATWGCVYLLLPGVMVTLIVQMAVMSYLDVTAVSYFSSVSSSPLSLYR